MSDEQPQRRLTRGDVMTAQQLADELLPDTSRDTILRWARDGTLPCRKRGAKVYFIRPEIEDWLLADGTRERAA